MRLRHPIALALLTISLAATGCGEEDASEVADDAREQQSAQAEEQGGSGGGGEQSSGEATTGEQAAQRTKPEVEVPEGPPPEQLRVEDVIEGAGPEVSAGQQITVNYVGVSYSNGQEFDASFDRGEPFPFALGGGMVIPGWDQGIEGMKVGGRRRLIIPSDLAYGPQGQPPVIAPDETLIFEIDLLAAQ